MSDYDGSPKQAKWAASIISDFLKHLDPLDLSDNDMFCLGLTESNIIIDYRESLKKGDSTTIVADLDPKWILSSKVDEYSTFLLEKTRSPARGGNTSAIHSHKLVLGGIEYYFKARGVKKWIFKSDSCSFAYYCKDNKNIVVKGTIETIDKSGEPVVRGDRREKNVLRVANQRLPCSRREAKD